MIHRKARHHYTDPRFLDDSWEIEKHLTKDMQETIDFLEQCTDDEINMIYDELFAVIDAFSENGEGVFIDFLRDYILTRSGVEIQDEIEGIIESLKEYEKEKNQQVT